MNLRLVGGKSRKRRQPVAVGNAGLVEVRVGRLTAKLTIAEAVDFTWDLQRALDLARLQSRVMKLRVAK